MLVTASDNHLNVTGNKKISFKLFVMKFKAWLHNVVCESGINSEFDLVPSTEEGKTLDLTNMKNKLENEASKTNHRSTNSLMLTFKTTTIMK